MPIEYNGGDIEPNGNLVIYFIIHGYVIIKDAVNLIKCTMYNVWNYIFFRYSLIQTV